MGYSPDHKRIKQKYNPKPNAEERRHEERLEQLPCFGCGRRGVSLHHTMLRFPAKRFRRDHRFQLPLCWDCHQGDQGIHGIGSEELWAESIGRSADEIIAYVQDLWDETQEQWRAA